MYKKLEYKEAGKFEETRFEKIHNVVFDNSNIASIAVAQEIADSADSEEEMNNNEYDGVFGRLAEQSLKECLRKLKKARTDRSMFNSFKQVMS